MAFWRKSKPTEINPETETREGKKKVGLIRRLWRKFRNIDWKNPINRWKLGFALLFGLIAMSGTAYGAIAFTSNPIFCSSCHEMAPEYQTFKASAHSEIKCTQCHIEPGAKNMVLHKIESMKEVYYHIVGPPDPIVQTVPVMKVNCGQCHSDNRLVTATGDLKVNHKGHVKEGVPCITCHAGVAHAKVVDRGINGSETYDHWTKENIKKLMTKEYTNPNMGTCIDCHDKVNKGEKPWEDIAYSLPVNTHGAEKSEGGEKTVTATAEPHEAGVTGVQGSHETTQKTQEIILQAIGKQKKDVKLSMECFTCHKEVAIPKSHEKVKWNESHGGTALNELNECINCHQDTKWIRDIPKQDIMTLLKDDGKKEKYIPNIKTVKDQSRDAAFCSTCHGNRPPGHVDSDTWLTAHASKAKTNEAKATCYVCHDKEKPAEGTKATAPTDVYCQYCHRTGFKGEKGA
ncbi:cytochrome c3 family protein [Bacillus sp. B-jedd]|uniref:cytochrome c3 family protein n=1 Tax=Bacillus sp. B-jedd TaxID=1476857 RepID=UPI00051567BD|nr:NapC/NirT family cytochrome c [Bacillus sp. B-jedd]CEG29057.1 nitrate/TMAO reductase membrane-bound tetraheme cytochrome c subunit-like protein [Bacillus sp. B-jedd]